MQRQSLGSPLSKLHFHGGSLPKLDNDAAAAAEFPASPSLLDYDDKRLKTARRFSSSSSSSAAATAAASSLILPPSHQSAPEKLIHLIPIVVLFCFLILYLVSHNPNSPRLDVFENTAADSSNMDSIAGVGGELKDVVAIRSFRNLQEETGESSNKHRSIYRHRKVAADF